MIRKILALIFGQWCDSHGRAYYSDFCPSCVRARIVRDEIVDRRPSWTKKQRDNAAAERQKKTRVR